MGVEIHILASTNPYAIVDKSNLGWQQILCNSGVEIHFIATTNPYAVVDKSNLSWQQILCYRGLEIHFLASTNPYVVLDKFFNLSTLDSLLLCTVQYSRVPQYYSDFKETIKTPGTFVPLAFRMSNPKKQPLNTSFSSIARNQFFSIELKRSNIQNHKKCNNSKTSSPNEV